MAKRHKNGVLYLEMRSLIEELKQRVYINKQNHGEFNSPHEIYAVLQQELDKYWDSLKSEDPDPDHLISLASCSIDAILITALKAREELFSNNEGENDINT